MSGRISQNYVLSKNNKDLHECTLFTKDAIVEQHR